MNTLFDNKLTKPKLIPAYVQRKHINQILDKDHDLIKLVASAGSGKSTLMSHWLEEKKHTYIWYTLDEDDNNPLVFLKYLLRSLYLNNLIDEEIIKLLTSTEQRNFRNFESMVMSVLMNVDTSLYLVLDDFHKIINNEIITFLKKLFDFTGNIKFILVSRNENIFPSIENILNRNIIELGNEELHFSKREFRNYLSVNKHKINQTLIDRIYKKSEGWLMGIQLMTTFKFDSHVMDDIINERSIHLIKKYMIEEILFKAPSHIIDFVYITSMMTYFDLSICHYLIPNSSYLIDDIKKNNYFLVVVDEKNKVYRYHHLFKEALDNSRDSYFKERQILEYKSKVGKWYEDNNYYKKAIEIYLSYHEYGRVIDLLKEIWPSMDQEMQLNQWKAFLDKIPLSFYKHDVVIQLGLGWSHLQNGNLSEATKSFSIVSDLSSKDGIDSKSITSISRSLKVAGIYIDAMNKAYEDLIDKVNPLVEVYNENQQVAVLYILKSCAHWALGDYLDAEEALKKGRKFFNDELMRNMTDMTLIDLYLEMGYLKKASFLLGLVRKRIQYNPVLKVMNANIELLQAKYYFYHSQVEKAFTSLVKSESYSTYALDDYEYNYNKLKARLYLSQSLSNKAKEVLGRMSQLNYPSPVPESVTLQDLENEVKYQETFELDSDDYMSEHYMKLFTLYQLRSDIVTSEHIKNLEVLLRQAELQKRISSQVDLALLLSLCYEKNNNGFLSLKYEKVATKLVETHKYSLPFYLYKIIEKEDLKTHVRNNELSEPLSKRELEVLSLIAEGFTNKDIGKKLYLTEATVKSYNKSIYRKLDVNRRTQATSKAKSLGIIK